MADATIRASLTIDKGNISYQSKPTQFTASIATGKGPAPGAFAVSTAGTDVDLSELTQPGLYRIQNLDATNFVTLGIWDGVSFFPIHEILAGETYVGRFSRNLGEEEGSTGTGTIDSGNTLRIKADTAECNVVLEAFDA